MRTWMLGVGAAALAITAPGLSQGQGNKGGGKDKGGKDHAAHAMKADHQGGKGNKAHGANHRDGPKIARGNEDKGKVRSQGRGSSGDKVRVVSGDDDRGKGRDVVKVRGRDDYADIRIVRRDFDDGIFPGRGRGLIDGCPPGLDKRDNGCMPPGQVNKLLGARLPDSFTNAMVPFAMRSWFRDDDDHFFRAGDGFVYRVDRDNGLIDGLIPTFGNGYYTVGDPWPAPYNFYNVPYQYRDYWSDGGNFAYRYGDGAIYRVNSSNGVVDSIVALLAGDLGVGSRLPIGYDAYNVPFAYRDRYADTADAWYRYNDGYIYRVDPTTRLVTAVIDALV